MTDKLKYLLILLLIPTTCWGADLVIKDAFIEGRDYYVDFTKDANCVGAWRFNDYKLGSYINRDISGQDFHATVYGNPATPLFKPAKEGSGWLFDGDDKTLYLAADVYSEATFAGGATIVCWIQPTTATPNAGVRVISVEGRFEIQESADSANKWSAFIYDGANQIAEANDNIVADTWTHLAVVWDTSTLMLYVDGVLQTDTDGSNFGTIDAVSRYTTFGMSYDRVNNEFPGYIDEVAIFSRELTAAEIKQIYERGLK